MRHSTLLTLLIAAANGCAAGADDNCSATRLAYSCFNEDVYVTVCAKCEPAPNVPGAKQRDSCSVLWANMSCVATIDGHRWAGSSTRLDCVVDGGTGEAVHYSFDLGSHPAVAYMTSEKEGGSDEMMTAECSDTSSE